MGAHGTFEDALKSVTSFVDAVNERDKQQSSKHPKKHSKKHSKKKESSKKGSKKRKGSKKDDEKKRKKKHKHSKRQASSSSSSGSSGSDSNDGRVDINTQLERGREAVRLTRQLLVEYPNLRGDLREILRRIDSGESVDIQGLPDPVLRALLQSLFAALSLQRTSRGLFSSSSYHSSVVAFLAPIMEEGAQELAAKHGQQAQQQRQQQQQRGAAPRPVTSSDASPTTSELQRGEQRKAVGPAAATAAHIGPQTLPGTVGVEEEQEGVCSDSDSDPGPDPASRVVGPAMPPPEVLAAAAEAAKQMAVEEEEGSDEDELLVGPPPPEFVAEADAVAGDERAAEVVRVLRLLSDASGAGQPPDPYALLGIEHDTKGGDVKKHYWRLSLVIHPDKCSHPRAHDAFQAVGKAAKELQDATQRALVDKRLEQQRLDEGAQEMMQQQERERQWRIVRGEATAEDMAGPSGPAQRDTWMTDVPAAQQGPRPCLQVNVTTFSMRGVQGKRDTSGWTAIAGKPQQQGPELLTNAQGSMAIEGGPACDERTAMLSGLVDTYNASMRKKSLVEQHQERAQEEKKAAKKKKKRKADAEPAEGKGKNEWAGKHPWRPFDREKDLNVTRAVDPAEALKKAGDLASRFGGSGGQGRTFL